MVGVPTTLVYLPAGQLVCAAQVSEVVLLIDITALNVPDAHTAHSDWAMAEAAFAVYLPAGHVVAISHRSVEQPVCFPPELVNRVRVYTHDELLWSTLAELPGWHK